MALCRQASNRPKVKVPLAGRDACTVSKIVRATFAQRHHNEVLPLQRKSTESRVAVHACDLVPRKLTTCMTIQLGYLCKVSSSDTAFANGLPGSYVASGCAAAAGGRWRYGECGTPFANARSDLIYPMAPEALMVSILAWSSLRMFLRISSVCSPSSGERSTGTSLSDSLIGLPTVM